MKTSFISKFSLILQTLSLASFSVFSNTSLKKDMGDTYRQVMITKQEEDNAEAEIWKYVFGFTNLAVLRCAIELGIAEAIEKNGSPMTLSDLSSALECEPSLLQRIMRFLIHLKFFKEEPTTTSQLGSIAFQQTPLSSRLMRHGDNSMAAFILLESSPVMLASWHNLKACVLGNGKSAFENSHGKDVWSYASSDSTLSKLFNEAMACNTRLDLPAMIEGCPEVFDGLETLVDVGGNNGKTLQALIKAFPWIRGINFDLPHVIDDVAEKCHGVELVGGDMFNSVPKADAALIKGVLHDWGDDECIQILKNCREAIPKDKGKLIIVEAIIDEGEKKDNKFESVALMQDMVMMAQTNRGKERSLKEWDYVLRLAGFNSYKVKPIHAVKSVIEAFP